MIEQYEDQSEKPKIDLSDYVDVAERISLFYETHPTGSLQSEIIIQTPERVTVRALAYRTPEDTHPGTGHASMKIPGLTRYTRGSELENTETSAWGRAIASLGIASRRHIASRQDVQRSQDEQRTQRLSAVGTINRECVEQELAVLIAENELTIEWLLEKFGASSIEEISDRHLVRSVERLREMIANKQSEEELVQETERTTEEGQSIAEIETTKEQHDVSSV